MGEKSSILKLGVLTKEFVGVWTQALTLASQALYYLSHSATIFCDGYFQDSRSQTFSLAWLRTVILLISTSQVGRIIAVSYRQPFKTFPFNCSIYFCQLWGSFHQSDVLDALVLWTGFYWITVVTLQCSTTAVIDEELSCKLLGLIAKPKLKYCLKLPLNNNNIIPCIDIVPYNLQSTFTYIISFNIFHKSYFLNT
jgi:hypothetical protein